MTINDLGTRHNEDIQTITDRVLAIEQEEAELVNYGKDYGTDYGLQKLACSTKISGYTVLLGQLKMMESNEMIAKMKLLGDDKVVKETWLKYGTEGTYEVVPVPTKHGKVTTWEVINVMGLPLTINELDKIKVGFLLGVESYETLAWTEFENTEYYNNPTEEVSHNE